MSCRRSNWTLPVLVCIATLLPGGATAQNVDFALSDPVEIATTDPGLQAVAVGDVNNDQRPDIVVVSGDAGEGPIAVLINNGDGTFTAPRFITDTDDALLNPVAVAIADVGAVAGGPDGSPDIIILEEEEGFIVAFGDNEGNFTLEGDVSTIDGLDMPVGLAVGDFDGQAGLDLAILDEDGTDDNGQVHFLCNSGQFAAFNLCATSLITSNGERPIDIAAGDFNGDERVDIVVLNQGEEDTSGNGTLALFIGGGDGSFTEPQQETFPIPRVAQDLAVGDMNPDEDDIDDVAVVDDDTLGEDNTSLFFGGTSGAIFTRRGAVLELGTTTVTIGIFAGSNDPDLAGVNNFSGTDLTILLGNGTSDDPPFATTGGFIGAQFGDAASVLLSAAFNDDELDDVVVLTRGEDADDPQLIVAINETTEGTVTPGTPGPGTPTRPPQATPTPTGFATPNLEDCQVDLPAAAGSQPLAMVTGDFDGDADRDLAVLDNDGHRIIVYLINPAALIDEEREECTIDEVFFIEFNNPAVQTYGALAVGRLNTDSIDDLAVAGASGVKALIMRGRTVEQRQVDTGSGFESVAIGNFDTSTVGTDDGRGGDIAVAQGDQVIVFRGSVDGSSFSGLSPITIAGALLVASGDLDGDDRVDDLAVATTGTNNTSVYILIHGTASGPAPFPTPAPQDRVVVGGTPFAMVMVDKGMNRADDIVVATQLGDAGFVVLLRRNNSGRFGASTAQSTGEQPRALGAGALVGTDGNADAVVATNASRGSLSFLPGNADGTFAGRLTPVTVVGEGPSAVVTGDFDGDRLDDVVVASSSGGISVLSLLLSRLVPPTPTPTSTGTPGPATLTATAGPSRTPTPTRTTTAEPTGTFKPGSFELSSCSIVPAAGRDGGGALGLLLAGATLIAVRVRRRKV